MTNKLRVIVVAGETSGDMLGAGLINALKQRHPNISFAGVGGELMQAAGCDCWYAMERIGVIGLDGIIKKLPDILSIRRDIEARTLEQKADLFLGIDVPDFNIGLEARLRKQGIKVAHLVSPTVWAWRGYRIHKIKRAVDHMLTLFPFEATYYQQHQVPVTCVGHPMADEIKPMNMTVARRELNLNEAATIIALLPGSRGSEVMRLSKLLVATARRLYAADKSLRFMVPFASQRVADIFHDQVGDISDLPLDYCIGSARTVMASANVAILASGTAALEAALVGQPFVVVYKLSPFAYWLVNRLRHVDHYSMPNHLLASPIVPEYIQDQATPEALSQAVRRFLDVPAYRAEMQQALTSIQAQLKRNTNELAATTVLSLIAPAAQEPSPQGSSPQGSGPQGSGH